MPNPLAEIAESMLKLLESSGAESLPVIDMMAEWVRLGLKLGYSGFQDQVEKLLMVATDSRATRKRLLKKFYEENKLRIAELVLSEREIG